MLGRVAVAASMCKQHSDSRNPSEPHTFVMITAQEWVMRCVWGEETTGIYGDDEGMEDATMEDEADLMSAPANLCVFNQNAPHWLKTSLQEDGFMSIAVTRPFPASCLQYTRCDRCSTDCYKLNTRQCCVRVAKFNCGYRAVGRLLCSPALFAQVETSRLKSGTS